MKRVIERCCGSDVHKKTVVACAGRSRRARPACAHLRHDGARTPGVAGPAGSVWRHPRGELEHGIYWKPIFYVREDAFTCVLANAAQIAQVPGRKTDVMDCVWIAQLLEHGLVRESFVHQKHAKAIAAALSPTSGCSGPGVSATRSRE